MNTLKYIPFVAGILLSGQVIAAEPQSLSVQAQPGVAVPTVATVAESAQPSQTMPMLLSATELDRVTAGVGRDNVGNEAWGALLDAGFTLNHNVNPEQGVIDHAGFLGVAVPNTVPNSFCIAFC